MPDPRKCHMNYSSTTALNIPGNATGRMRSVRYRSGANTPKVDQRRIFPRPHLLSDKSSAKYQGSEPLICNPSAIIS